MTQHQLRTRGTPQDGKVVLDAVQLKALRKRRGLSQIGLAQLCIERRLCVSIASIKRAETGKPVLYRTASHLARMYALPLDDLVAASAPSVALSPAPVADHPDQRGLPGAPLPLVARHVELQQFKATLDAACLYQSGHLVYLRGVAGIGKSRLIAEFAECARQRHVACHSATVPECGTHDGSTPLGQLAHSLLGLDPACVDGEAQLQARVHAAGLPPQAALHYRAILGMPQPAGDAAVYAAMSQHARAQGQVDALRALILRRAGARPLLLMLEDIHRGSAELLAKLAALLHDVREAPVIWVLSARCEHDPFEATLRPYLNGLPITLLDLGTLRQQEALALAQLASKLDAGFRARCVARAEGNPLFLTELLLSGHSETLPRSLRTLVQAKLDQLPAQERRALCIGAAIGRCFPLARVRQVLGQPGHDLHAAVRQCFVRPGEPGSFSFVHELVMQAICESMSGAQRAAIDAALAGCRIDTRQDTAGAHTGA